jgi:hypothetical protein
MPALHRHVGNRFSDPKEVAQLTGILKKHLVTLNFRKTKKAVSFETAS